MGSFRLNRRQFLAGSAAIAGTLAVGGTPRFAAASPNIVGMTSSSRSGETVKQLAVKDPTRIKALQFTDLHFFCKPQEPRLDQETVDDMARYVDMVAPDMLFVTGDTWHDNPDHRGEEFMHFAVEKIAALGVPWVFTWGNHDMLDDYPAGHDYLTDAPHSLYCGGPDAGNYRVELTHDGQAVWELVCMNSSDRGLLEPQRDWLRKLADGRKGLETPPAFALIHIPIKQYDDVWEQGLAAGIKLEDVSYWDEDGTSYAVLKKACDFRGYFCGHDHVNNFQGRYEDTKLVFGQATGHGGYGSNLMPKGATVITMDATAKRFACESIFPDGTRWRPTPDLRIDDVDESPWDVPANRHRRRERSS